MYCEGCYWGVNCTSCEFALPDNVEHVLDLSVTLIQDTNTLPPVGHY